MSFDYDKLKEKDSDNGSHWASYSDLFMVLSVVFLLLYVVASVRSKTSDAFNIAEFKKMESQNEDLRRQIRAYNTLKDDYVENDAKKEEQELYEQLMGKLDLLQEETDQERKKLENKAKENENKVAALNQYQQMVRNIINTNMLAKKRITRRDNVIVKKRAIISEQIVAIKELDETLSKQANEIKDKVQVIEQKEALIVEQESKIQGQRQELVDTRKDVNNLEDQISLKKQMLASNEEKIKTLNSNLDNRIKQLKKTEQLSKRAKKLLKQKVSALRLKNRLKVKKLAKLNEEAEVKLSSLSVEVQDANTRLEDASRKIQQEEAQKQKLLSEMEDANKKYQAQTAQLESDFQGKFAQQRKNLENKLAREKASAAEKERRMAEFKEQTRVEKNKLDQALGALTQKVNDAEGKLSSVSKKAQEYADKLDKAKQEHGRYLASIDKLKDEKKNLSGDLKRVRNIANAKKNLAKKIAKRLMSKGIKANVDPKSGDVTLAFGDDYFDAGKANLKGEMESVLRDFFPVYARSLLEDTKVSEKVNSVEIIGFSSPTYQGKYVDPRSLNEKDRAALDYNLDLSFKRAKSIFKYMTNTKKMKFKHQKKILPLVKVTGRSFLVEGVKGRDVASGISTREYCKKYNCKKSQKVIIRFNLKD